MDENLNEKKKSNVLKYALTFVAGTAIGVGGLFSYNTFIAKSPNLTTDCVSVKESSTKTEKESTSADTTKVEKSSLYSTLKDDNYTYSPRFGDSRFISYNISGSDMKNCHIQATKEYLNTAFGVKLNTTALYVGADVTFDVPVKQVIFGGKGQAVSKDDCVLFLLQDGTVRYLNFVQAFTSTEFSANYDKLPTPKVVDGVSDIDILYEVGAIDNNPNNVGGFGETIGVKKDGTIVHLMDLVK